MIRRIFKIDIDGTVISNMRAMATITKSILKSDPDFCEVTIYNLAIETRQLFSTAKKLAIYGGHGDPETNDGELVYLGDIINVQNRKENTEWVSIYTCGDGASAIKQSVINKTYTQPMTPKDIITDIVDATGISSAIEFVSGESEAKTTRSYTANGDAKGEIDAICNSNDLYWSIQDDVMVVTDAYTSRQRLSYIIRVETGMIGSPEWVNRGTTTNKVNNIDGNLIKVKSLLIPSIKPCDQINIVSELFETKVNGVTFESSGSGISANFKVETISHSMNTHDGEFSTEIEARAL